MFSFSQAEMLLRNVPAFLWKSKAYFWASFFETYYLDLQFKKTVKKWVEGEGKHLQVAAAEGFCL